MAIKQDQEKVLNPDLSKFRSFQDILSRLLPYHIFQYRDADLAYDKEKFDADGTSLVNL
jgi:hypothetical protein